MGPSDFSVPRRSNGAGGQQYVGRALLDDLALFHEQDVRSEGAGEIHLVRGHDHGHAAVREVTDNREHFADKLGVEGGGRLVEEHDLGVHGKGAGMATRCFCPPESWAG